MDSQTLNNDDSIVSTASTAQETAKEKSKSIFPCDICGRVLKSKNGRTNHQNKCKKKGPENLENSGEREDSTEQTSTVNSLTSNPEL